MSETPVPVPCCRCGQGTVAVPSAWLRGAALCGGCRPAPAIPAHSVPWAPVVPRVRVGELTSTDGAARRAAAALMRRRVLLTGRRAETADPTVMAVLGAVAGCAVEVKRVGYALVEDIERGELVHVVKLYATLGWGWWRNGRFDGGISWHERLHACTHGLAEWRQHAAGQYWEPPPTPPCPRCGRPVRLTLAGEPYAHNKPIEKGGGRCLTLESIAPRAA